MVFCTEFLGGWWSWQSLLGSCVRLGWYPFLKSLMPLYKSPMFLILLSVSRSSILALIYAFFLFLKCLLTSRLTLFRLSTLFLLGSCIHCILACFLWSKKPKHSSSNQGLFCFSSCRLRLAFAEVWISSLMFSLVLSTSSSSFKFSEAANLFVISIWYCSLTSFMQCIYTYIRETNYVPRKYSVAAILLLLFMVLIR